MPTHACDLVSDRTPVPLPGVVGDHDRDELLVTHNFLIGRFVHHVLDTHTWRWLGLNQDNCGPTIVAWEAGRPPVLASFNVGHL